MSITYTKQFTYNLDGKVVSPKLIKADCDNEMIEFAFNKAFQALEKYTIEKDISAYIKHEFDSTYDKTWHCVVGGDYSVSLTHDSEYFLFFSIDKNYFLLFKL